MIRPSNQNQPWLLEDDEQLLELMGNSASHRDMAAALGRSRTSIRNRIRKLERNNREPIYVPPVGDPWPDLGAHAFKDVKVSADPAVQLSRPQDRTLGGVGTSALTA